MDLEKLCRDFHANLKLLYWQTLQEYEKEKENKDKLPEVKESRLKTLKNEMESYNETYKKIGILQERRHLTLVGEKGGYKEAYQRMLQIIGDKYINKDEEKEKYKKLIDYLDYLSFKAGEQYKKVVTMEPENEEKCNKKRETLKDFRNKLKSYQVDEKEAKMLQAKIQTKEMQDIEEIIREINELCEEYNIEVKGETKEKENER